jgi:hypothetical protein
MFAERTLENMRSEMQELAQEIDQAAQMGHLPRRIARKAKRGAYGPYGNAGTTRAPPWQTPLLFSLFLACFFLFLV